jgi:hypothetical protein
MKIRTGTNTTDTTLWSDYSGSDPCYQNDSNMILGLAFSEGSGNFTKDIITGSKYVNMSNNDFWVEGKHGFGAYMYGEDSIDISDVSALRLSSPKNYSIEIWVKPKTTQNIAILGKLKYYLYLNGSGNVVFNASYDSNVTSTASISTLSNDSWSSIIVTYDSDNTTKLYINGSLEKTQLNNGTMDESTVALCLGYSTGLSTFNGTIDSFVIYNRTLSDLEAYTHGTDKLTNASGEYTGKLSKYVQYRIYFETNNTAQTPQLQSSAIKFFGFSNDVYDSAPENISLSFPQNNTAVHTESVTLNWTTASDLEGDPVAYELVVSNYSNFSSIIISNLAINNFSYIKIDDDNYGGMVEHLDTRKYLQGEERWSGNWSDTYSQGWNGEGMNFHIQGEFMRTSKELVNESGTIEFWVKPGWNASDGNTNYFIQDSNNEINLNRTGTIIYLKLGLNGYLTYNISSWNSSDWHHVGISWQKNKNLTLNIDGVEVNKTSTSLIITGTGGYFYLGSNASTSNNLLANGTIDEFRVSSVARVAVSNLTKNNFTITTKDLSDGVYYWKVRPIQARNNSKEGEKYYGTWSDTWILSYDPHTPELSVVDDPVKVLGSINTSINLSSSENVYCEYRTRSTNYAPMSTTGGTNHSQTINFTGFGNFTYYINCNDSSNNFVNTTMVFYVFNKSAGDLIMTNTTKWNFTANQEQYLNFTNVYDKSYATINITTKNNLTGKAIAVRHDWLYNPESSGTGLPNAIVAYWTVVPDDWVTMNLSGNASITLRYYFVDISSLNTNILYIYYFENSTGAWRQLTETCSKYDFNVTFSTASFGTYALAGTVPTSSSTPGRGSSEGRGAAARAALAARLLAQRLAMLARRATPFIGFHDQVTNETTVVEEETPVEETEKEEETIATQAIKRISESVNESPWLWIVIYVIVAGVGTFFVARVGLAAILTFKKGKISIEELEKEEENIDRVKYYIYKNVDNPSMDQELLKKGWDANEVIRVIKGVKRLGRGRLEEYIYRKLSEGAEEEALVRTLVAKKWNEDAVRREIEKFKRI